MKSPVYTESLFNYKRRKTHSVNVGGIPLGGDNPVRIQSMANTPTCDTEASVNQCIAMADAGADYVRFTVPSTAEAECFDSIKKELECRGYRVPLIADVHFNPAIAMLAAGTVSKVRINPGNYGGAAREDSDFTETAATFRMLIEKCRENGVVLRIGVNHGSLSPRMIAEYGDTPLGMAESAMEFLRLCSEKKFSQVVVSMKSSNVIVMVQSVRLLVAMMRKEGMTFPVHLGVTEAGEGEDGRIKSATGIGALLADGIGDTIRVSLTEDPVAELPVASKLVRHFESIMDHSPLPELQSINFNPYSQQKRQTLTAGNTGGANVPVVIAGMSEALTDWRQLSPFGWHYDNIKKTWRFDDSAADYVFAPSAGLNVPLPETKGIILPVEEWALNKTEGTHPLTDENFAGERNGSAINFIKANINTAVAVIPAVKDSPSPVLVYTCSNSNINGELRLLFSRLDAEGCNVPVIVHVVYHETDFDDLLLKSAADLGSTFIDGFSNGIWIGNLVSAEKTLDGTGSLPANSDIVKLSFGILQACRARIFKTEYISCPSCGRTHFNIMKALAEIKARTGHLKGLKIGVMGCIVNGPGEMADADYGYVGAGRGKITLYKSKEVIRRNIPEKDAVDELVNLIKAGGDWTDAG